MARWAARAPTPDGDALRWHGVLWRDGEVIDLVSPPGAGESAAVTINNRGVVLGAFRTSEGFSTSNFIWADGVLTRLDPALFASDLTKSRANLRRYREAGHFRSRRWSWTAAPSCDSLRSRTT